MPPTTPLSAAFSTTTLAALLLMAGGMGYSLSHGFLEGTWTGGVVWWEIRLGLLCSLFAIYFWRKGLRSIR